jgi:prevent-host-death family protein
MENVVTDQSVNSQSSPGERVKSEEFTGDIPTSQVSVRELKAHLSQWLARAQAGELVEITSHRRAIARISGLKPPVPAAAHPLQAAIDAGLVSWNGNKPVIPTPIVLKGSGKLISAIVLEDRG